MIIVGAANGRPYVNANAHSQKSARLDIGLAVWYNYPEKIFDLGDFYMKKIILIVLIGLFAVGLVGCEREELAAGGVDVATPVLPTEPPPVATSPMLPVTSPPTTAALPGLLPDLPPVYPDELVVYLDFLCEDALADFDYVHQFDYRAVRGFLGGIDPREIEEWSGGRLMMRINQPVADFYVQLVGNDFIDGNLAFIPIANFGLIRELSPDCVIVINNYMGIGTMPWSGVTFTDMQGNRRYFTMMQNQAYPNYGGMWIVREFENRADELPADWESWWRDDFAPPCDARRAGLLADSGISEYGFLAAANFLADFTTLFEPVTWMSYDPGDGIRRFTFGWDELNRTVIRSYRPLGIHLQHTEQGAIFIDRAGNLISDAPWIYRRHWETYDPWINTTHEGYELYFVNYFMLFDFDDTGIPDIVMHFHQTFEGCYGGFYRIFRYFDGEYRMLDAVQYQPDGENWGWVLFGSSNSFFTDADGRIITFIDSALSGAEYTHLILTDTHSELHTLPIEFDWNAWVEHHWQNWQKNQYGQMVLIDSWINHNPVIFGTNIAITPLLPFADLADEMTNFIFGGQ